MWRRRISRIQTRKKNFNKKFLLPVILIIVPITGFLVFKLGIFNIKQVEVESNVGCADTDQLKQASNLVGQNYFLINSQKVLQDLQKKFLCVKSTNLIKYFPSQVKMQVVKRDAVAALSLMQKEGSMSSLLENLSTPSAGIDEQLFLVDDEGVVFVQKPDMPGVFQAYLINQKITLGDTLKDPTINFLKIFQKVKTLGVNITNGWIYDKFFVINTNMPGPKIIFRLDSALDMQLASLQLILAEAKMNIKYLEFIDLRFDKPIIKEIPKK